MGPRRALAIVWAASLVLHAQAALAGDPFIAHRIIARHAVDALPPDARAFFRQHQPAILHHLDDPAVDWPANGKLRQRNNWHRVEVDLTAKSQAAEARARAAAAFPRDLSDAQRLYRRTGHRVGGELPWAVEKTYRDLVNALHQGQQERIVRSAAHLLHFVGDLADPFALTLNHDGSLTGNAVFGHPRGVHPRDDQHSVRARFAVGLTARYARVYGPAAEVSAEDVAAVHEPRYAVFAHIGSLLGMVDAVAQADREVLAELKIATAEQLRKRRAAYFERLDARCGDLCVRRLAAAARLATALLHGAWREAGAPAAVAIGQRASNGDGSPPADARKPSSQPARFIGSRHSNIYHRPGCRFAAQIAADNLIEFGSAASAVREGRRGCRYCKPP